MNVQIFCEVAQNRDLRLESRLAGEGTGNGLWITLRSRRFGAPFGDDSPMPFRHGSISFARFRLAGDVPTAADDALFDRLAEHTVQPPSVGAPPELQAGWCAGRHVFDASFDADTMLFGEHLLPGVRIDTNKVPAEIRKAYRAMAESAYAMNSPTGVLSRSEKQAAKEEAEARCRQELADGQHRSSKLIPVWWDLARRMIYAPCFSDASVTALNTLIFESFDATIDFASSGALAHEWLSEQGKTRDFDDAKPSRFTPPPAHATNDDGRDLATPAVPWALGGPEPKDFLGNEFLIWLWWMIEAEEGLISTNIGEIAVIIDAVLDMDCAWDATGKQSLRATGPARLPEARKALEFGKWPRKAGLILAHRGEQWSLTLQADRFLFTGVKLPKPEGDDAPKSPREEIEQRLNSLEQLDRTMLALYHAFLRTRFDPTWSGVRERISKWIRGERAAKSMPKVEVLAH